MKIELRTVKVRDLEEDHLRQDKFERISKYCLSEEEKAWISPGLFAIYRRAIARMYFSLLT